MDELEDFGITEHRWELGDSTLGYHNDGTLEDAMHPQARYTIIQRVHGECLRVSGRRPRIFNMGVKKFDISIVPREDLRGEGSKRVNKLLVDELQHYFLNR